MALFMLLFAGASAARAERDVIIFADFACTESAAGDPDDCLAVKALQDAQNINILAVVASGGNATRQVSHRLGRMLFPDLRILPGSNPRVRWRTKTHEIVADLAMGAGAGVSVLVLSPAGDFAMTLRQRPRLLDVIKGVVLVAGRAPGDRFEMVPGGRVLRDMNYEKDRRAMQEVLPRLFRHRVATRFVGFRAAMNTTLPEGFMDHRFVPEAQRAWARKTRFWFGARLPPFDVVAAMALTRYVRHLQCHPVKIEAGRDLLVRPARRSYFSFCD